MSVSLKPIPDIIVDLGIQPKGPMQQDLTNIVYKKMYRYIPYSGLSKIHLRENIQKTEDSITFKSSYAKYQYYGSQNGNKWHYTTPGTGPYWDKKMLNVEKKNILKEIARKYGG